MEILSTPELDFPSARPIELAHSFRLESLQASDEGSMVDMIKRTLMSFPDEGEVLAGTLRRLPNFYQSYQRAGSSYLVIKDAAARAILGGVGLQAFAGLDPSEGLAEIRELVVDPQFRGLGLGRKLLQLAIQTAAKHGYRRIYLEATSQMKHAQALFQRSGFRPIHSPGGKAIGSQTFPSYFVLEGV
jgi:putative acetyltransferase